MDIKVKTTAMVKPLSSNGCTTTWLSNLDLASRDYLHVRTCYFYHSTSTTDNFFDMAVLTAALSQTLVEFYPVAGRLKRDGKGRLEINCNGEGALFVDAEADGEMDNFGPMSQICLTPEVDYSQGISAFPLLLLQVTRFKCGGVCLGVAIDHHVIDGISAIHFINTWSDISRGLGITVPPFMDRRILSARSPPRPKFTHVEYHPPPPLKNPKDFSNISQTTFSIFKLTRDQLNTLKSHLQEDEGNMVAYTSFEVLAGQLWRCVSKARGLQEDQQSKVYILVDGRLKLRPPLPQGYVGNVIFTATSTALCGELESNPVKFAVHKVHEAISRMDDEYMRSALDYLELQIDPSCFIHSDPFKCPNLGIISWSRLPLYDADFGWGKPIYVGHETAPREGLIYMLPTPINDGSLLCALSLPKEQMEVFKKLLYHI